MDIVLDDRVKKLVSSLKDEDKGRITGYIRSFRDNGFALPGKYLKKLGNNLWELRPGDVRVLFGKVGTEIIIVHMFKKKTQKTPKKEMETAKKRLKEKELIL